MLPMDAIQAIFKIFPVLGRHDFQHHTGKNDWIPASRIKPQAISVGNLGTRPVFRYSRKTGTNRITETAINNRASIPKKCSGL